MVADEELTPNPYASPELVEPSRQAVQGPLAEPLIAFGPVSQEQHELALAWIATLQLKQNRWTVVSAGITTVFSLASLTIPGGWPMAILFALLSINAWYQWWQRRERVVVSEQEAKIAPQAIRFRIINGGGIVVDGEQGKHFIAWSEIRCHTLTASGEQLVLATLDDCQVFTPEHFEAEEDWTLLLESVGYYARPG